MTDMRTKEAAFGTVESDTHTTLDGRSSRQRYMEPRKERLHPEVLPGKLSLAWLGAAWRPEICRLRGVSGLFLSLARITSLFSSCLLRRISVFKW